MKIAIYGATGMVGSRVAAEAQARGHEVIGINRSGGSLPGGGSLVQGNAGDSEFAKRIAGEADVVVSAIGPSRTGGDRAEFVEQVRNLADTLGDARLVVVGGAGSLVVNGQRLVDNESFPDLYRPEALVQAEVLEHLRSLGESVDWTYLSPAPLIQPGERTGTYQVGGDAPVGDAISAEDYAVALLDEVETPAHHRTRFTVAN